MRGGLLAAVGVAPLLASGDGADAGDAARGAGPDLCLQPDAHGQRANAARADEGVAIARAAGRPQLSGTAGLNQDLTAAPAAATAATSAPASTSAIRLFNGGRVRNSVKAANDRVDAGRADLRATEGDIFTEAVAAYMDVIRDRSIVAAQRESGPRAADQPAGDPRPLRGRRPHPHRRRPVRSAAGARAEPACHRSRAGSTASEENYRRVIGELPGDLAPPPPLPPLPATPDQAVRHRAGNNPDLASIAAQARAAGYDVARRAARRACRPSRRSAAARYTNYLGTADGQFGRRRAGNTRPSTSVGLSLARCRSTRAALAGARVRQAQAIRGQLLEQAVDDRAARSSPTTRAAFAAYQAAQRGDRIERDRGRGQRARARRHARRADASAPATSSTCSTPSRNCSTARSLLVTARRDAYVAGFQLLNAMGQAEAEDLGPRRRRRSTIRSAITAAMSRSWLDWDDGPGAAAGLDAHRPPGSRSPVTEPGRVTPPPE